jgi:hypothetical protein
MTQNELKNYISRRIIRNAKTLGSAATTAAGAHRYVLNTQKSVFSGRKINRHTNGTQSRYLLNRAESRIKKHRAIVPLGSISENELRIASRAEHPRRKNWEPPQAVVSDTVGCWVSEVNCGRYSSRCTYIRYEYVPTVGSYGIIRGNLGLEYHYAGTVTVLQPPRGYRWDKDSNGIRLVSLTKADKNYHPNSDDLRKYSKKALLTKISRLAETRKQARKLAKETAAAVKRAEREGAAICVKDSVRAGNCQAGTINFARRHNLDPNRHYRPTELLKIANGDAHRVRLAVTVGLRRHRQEMGRGYCQIEDHR